MDYASKKFHLFTNMKECMGNLLFSKGTKDTVLVTSDYAIHFIPIFIFYIKLTQRDYITGNTNLKKLVVESPSGSESYMILKLKLNF